MDTWTRNGKWYERLSVCGSCHNIMTGGANTVLLNFQSARFSLLYMLQPNTACTGLKNQSAFHTHWLGAWKSSEVGNESHIDAMIIPGYMWYQTSNVEYLLRIFLTKSFLVICVRLLLRHLFSSIYHALALKLREPTLGPNLAMHTGFLPESWIFRFCEEYP